MSRFKRPDFAVPSVPTPPKVLALPRFLLAAGAVLKNAIARLGSFSLGGALTVNPVLAQIRAQEAVVKENLMKAKLAALAAIPVPPVPLEVLQSAQDNMEALQAYREQTQALFDSAAAEAEAAAGALGSQSGG